MRLSSYILVALSSISLTLAALPANFNPLDVSHMVSFLDDQIAKGNFDERTVLMVIGDTSVSFKDLRAVNRRYTNYKPLEALLTSNEYKSLIPSRYLNDFNARGALDQAAYTALGRIVTGITLFGSSAPDMNTPFFAWVLPAIEARQAAGKSVDVSSLKPGVSDLNMRKTVRFTTSTICRRDGACDDAVDLSAAWDAVQAKIKTLPHQTVTLEDGSTMDVPQFADADKAALADVATQDSTQWQAAEAADPSSSPEDPSEPTEPTDPNAPTTEEDPNTPTDPDAEPKSKPGKPKPATIKPPRAVRRGLRFGPRPSL